MSVVNRCAIGIAPRQPLIDWSRTIGGDDSLEWGADDRSVYLIPLYEIEAVALLEEVTEDIFSWGFDQSSWPSPQTFSQSRELFEVHFNDLIEDLSTTQPDEQFIGERRTALEGVQPLQ